MAQFTTKQLIGLTVIGAASCMVGIFIAPSDPYSEILASGFLFVFGGACYVTGLALAHRLPKS